MANILAPVCSDKSSFLERYLRAEVYRRIKDDTARREEVDKRFNDMRKEMVKHFKMYCQVNAKTINLGTDDKNNAHVIIPTRYMHHKSKYKNRMQHLVAKRKEDNEKYIKQKIVSELDSMILNDVRNNSKSEIKATKSNFFKSNNPYLANVYDPFELSNIISQADKNDRANKRKRAERSKISKIRQNEKATKNNKKIFGARKIRKTGATFRNINRTNDSNVFTVAKRQTSIISFANIVKYNCFYCTGVSDKRICDNCRKNHKGEMSTLTKIMGEMSIELHKEKIGRLDRCADCYGIKCKKSKQVKKNYKKELEKVGGYQLKYDDGDDRDGVVVNEYSHMAPSSTSKINDNEVCSSMAKDIEDCVVDYYSTYSSVSMCQKDTCDNLWNRRKNRLRTEKMELLKKQIFDK